MSKEPLYPHVPKRKEPLYPHVPKDKAITLEVPKELEALAQEAGKYKSAEEWRKFDKGKELSKVLIGGQGLLPSGTDINYLEKLEALRKWGGDKSDIEIVSAFYNQVTKVMGASPEAEIDQIIADLNLLREERVWIDTFKTTGASVIHIQTGDTATITSPPEDFTSPNYADRAMQIKWADGSEMVVDSNDFAPSSLQKQIAEITHGKPIPEFPKAVPEVPSEILPGGYTETKQLLEDLTSDTLTRQKLLQTIGEEQLNDLISQTEQKLAQLEAARIIPKAEAAKEP